MHPELIRAEIKMRDETLKSVAKQYGLQPKVVSLALYSPSLSGERAIAAFLGKSLHELWPERWTKDGRRIRPRSAHLYKASAA